MARRTAPPLKVKKERPSPKRDALVAAAEDLFDRYGFHATGVDRLVQDSGVARMTFYKHFPTKNALVRAVIQRRDERFWAWFQEATDAQATSGKDPVLAIFDALADWLDGEATHGCLLLRALGEFSEHDVVVAGDAAFRKRKTGQFLQDLLEKRGIPEAEARAWDLVLLIEGAVALGPVVGGRAAAGQARHAAQALLNAWKPVP